MSGSVFILLSEKVLNPKLVIVGTKNLKFLFSCTYVDVLKKVTTEIRLVVRKNGGCSNFINGNYKLCCPLFVHFECLRVR